MLKVTDDKKLILLVEDNPDDEALALRALRKSGVDDSVLVARDGAEALDLVFGNGEHGDQGILPDLILLDLNLPKLDGMEVLRRMRADERTRLVPVVILTSSREREDLVRGYCLGANSYLRKPTEFKQFLQALDEVARYWLGLNEPPPAQEVCHG